MTTHSVTLPSNKADLLFDDRSLLEAAFGKNAFKLSSANANCDCISHVPNEDDEEPHTYQIPAIAA